MPFASRTNAHLYEGSRAVECGRVSECVTSEEIDNTIQHYQRISWSITDQFTIDGINELIVRLEAQIMSSGPATIESPGAIATSASRSMMIPKDRLRRLCISQARVKWFAGASSCSRCNTAEVGPSPVGSTRRSRHQERLLAS